MCLRNKVNNDMQCMQGESARQAINMHDTYQLGTGWWCRTFLALELVVGLVRAWGKVWVGRVVGLVRSSPGRMVAWQYHTALEHCSRGHGPDGCSLCRPTDQSCMHGEMYQQQGRSPYCA